MHSETLSPDAAEVDKRSRWVRLGITAALLVALWVIAEATGARQWLTADRLRDWLGSAGPFGALGFVAAFSVGLLAQIPGLLFIGAAIFAYGPLLGFAAAYFGALIAVCVSFWIVRTTGGQSNKTVKSPRLAKLLSHLDRRPMRTIAMLRVLFLVSPPLNYALALSSVKFRDYALGSAAGLALPIALWVLLADRAFACVGII